MKKIFEYIEVILLILTCSSVYYLTEYKNYHLVEILIVVSFLNLIISIIGKTPKKEQITKIIVFCFFYYIIMLLFIVVNYSNLSNFIKLFLILLPIFYCQYKIYDNNECIKKILFKIPKVMTILAIISLVFYFIGSLANIIKPNGVITVFWGKLRTFPSYYGLHFNTQIISFLGNNIIRNTGLFPEAPMFSLNLTIALAIELFLVKEKSKYRCMILAFTNFTTLSTTGIMAVCFMIIIKYLLTNRNSRIYAFSKLLIFPIVAITLISISYYFLNDKMQSSSYDYRSDDYRAAYMAWLDHPIFGNGYNDATSIENYMSFSRGVSNSFMVILAEGGTYLFVIYLIPIIKAIHYGIRSENKNIIIFTGIIIYLFITTTFQYRPLLLNLLAVGYALDYKKIKQNMKMKNKIGSETL
jgi:O-antigen ligase